MRSEACRCGRCRVKLFQFSRAFLKQTAAMKLFIVTLLCVCGLVTASDDERLPNKCEGKEEEEEEEEEEASCCDANCLQMEVS